MIDGIPFTEQDLEHQLSISPGAWRIIAPVSDEYDDPFRDRFILLLRKLYLALSKGRGLKDNIIHFRVKLNGNEEIGSLAFQAVKRLNGNGQTMILISLPEESLSDN